MVKTRIEALQEFLQQTPEDPFVHFALALEHLKLEDRDQAEAFFLHLATQHPTYVGTYYHYAKLKYAQGETQSARELYIKGIEVAQAAKDAHSARELKAALAELDMIDESIDEA